jgi:hypothetical protein
MRAAPGSQSFENISMKNQQKRSGRLTGKTGGG